MRFLIIVDDYLPFSNKVAAKMMHELALTFRGHGHHVSVLAPVAGQKVLLQKDQLDGIETLSFRSGRIKNTGKIRRAINESLLSWFAWRAIKRQVDDNSFDGIIYYSPSIFWGYLVGKLKKKWSCRTYLILRDVFPQWAVDNGLLSKYSPAYWYFRIFEGLNYRYANRIGVMSPSNLAFFKKKLVNISRFEVLYNWASPDSTPLNSSQQRKALGLNDKIVFFYGGNIGHAQKIVQLINLAKELKGLSKVHFVFVGNGDEVEVLIKEKRINKLDNITYLKPRDQTAYFKLLSEFDIGLFSLHPGHTTHNFPGKVLGYMTFSKPVLGCVNSGNDLKEIINMANAGIIVESGDHQALVNGAKDLIASETRRRTLGENGFKLLKTLFSPDRAFTQIFSALTGKID